ncbi:MAG TPA: sugar nucleotide-binding protein, partial [Opitutus sp.]|nr:sugar nucleotide-binding protein [Opitutus sp.]
MKIFLTGASGLVGSAFARAAARNGHEIVGTVGRFRGKIAGLTRQLTLDLTDETAVTKALLDSEAEAVVNAAAISEPAACEKDPQGSAAMNVALPATLARLAQRLGAALVHVSSEQVFDGERSTAYAKGDATSPINVYGGQKVASERAVLEAASKLAAVVRAPLLMGDSPGGQRSLHERLLGDWAAGRTARLYVDE